MQPEIYDAIMFKLTERAPDAHPDVWESPKLAVAISIGHDVVIEALGHLKTINYIVCHYGQSEIGRETIRVASVKLSGEGKLFMARTSFVKEANKESGKGELSKKEETKLDQDIAVNKWLLKTKWWPLIISILSLVVALYAAYKQK